MMDDLEQLRKLISQGNLKEARDLIYKISLELSEENLKETDVYE